MSLTSETETNSEELLASTEIQRQANFFDVCSNCRTNYDCCHGTRPPISAERRRIIEKYLKKRAISISNAFEEEEYAFPREGPEGYCVFYGLKTQRCVIHEVKPETCVAGPITFDVNERTGNVEYFIKEETICHLAGVIYEDKKALGKHLKSAKREIAKLLKELSSEALSAILEIDEPETFKLG